MQGWLSRRFGSENIEDPLLKALNSDKSIMQSVKNILSSYLPNTPTTYQIEKVITTSTKIVEAFKSIAPQTHVKQSPELQLLANFLNPLFDTFQILALYSHETIVVVSCIHCITSVIDIPPDLQNPENMISSLAKLYSLKTVPTELVNGILCYFLTSRNFIVSIANVDFFAIISQNIFLDEKMKDGLSWLKQLFAIYGRNVNLKSADFYAIAATYLSVIPKIPYENLLESFDFFVNFAHIFVIDGTMTHFFVENNGLALIIAVTMPKDIPIIMAKAATISSEHFGKEIIQFMFEKLNDKEDAMAYVAAFKNLFSFTEYKIEEIDSIKPISLIFECDFETNEGVELLVETFAWISHRKYHKTIEYASKLYDFIASNITTEETQSLFFENLETYTVETNSFEELLNSKFIQSLVLSRYLLKKLIKCESFVNLLKGVFRVCNSTNLKWETLLSMFNQKIDLTVISSFFVINTTVAMMQEMLQHLQKQKTDQLSFFILAFQNEDCADVFCKCDGLVWFDIFPYVKEEFYAEFLSALVNPKTEEYMTQWIMNLGVQHRITKIDKKVLFDLCYHEGRIRIPSLLPLIDFKEALSPGVAIQVAPVGVPSFIKFGAYDSPVLDNMAKVYCSPEDFVHLLKNHPRPDELVDNDINIPMFEFHAADEVFFSVKNVEKALSFWVRMSSKKCVAEIFSSKYVSGRVVSNVITFVIEEEVIHFPIEPTEWFMLTISINSDSKAICVKINNQTFVHSTDFVVESLGDFLLGNALTKPSEPWFIGTSIINYKVSPTTTVKMIQAGPSVIPNYPNATVLTPFDDYQFNNVRICKSRGFSFYLSNDFNKFLLYEQMMNAKDPTHYIKCVLKIAGNSNFMWYSLVILLKERKISEDLMNEIFSEAARNGKIDMFLVDLEIMKKYIRIILRCTSTFQITNNSALSIASSLFDDHSLIEIVALIARRVGSSMLYSHLLNLMYTANESEQLVIAKSISVDAVSSCVFTAEKISELLMFVSQPVADYFLQFFVDASMKFDDYTKYIPTFVFSLLKCYSDKTWSVALSVLTGTSNIGAKDLVGTFMELHVRKEIFMPTIIAMILVSTTAIVAAAPADNESFGNDLCAVIRIITTYDKFDLDAFNNETIIEVLEFFAPFVFNISGIADINATSTDIRGSVIQTFNDAWNISPGCISDRECELSTFSYSFFLEKFVNKVFNTHIHVPKNVNGFDVLPNSTEFVNFYTELCVAFCLDNVAFDKVLHALLDQNCSRGEVQIGDISLHVIVAMFAKSETYSAPPEVFISLFEFIDYSMYEGFFTNIFLLFSSFLPVLAAAFKSPQIEGIENNERCMNPLRNILLHIFELSLDDAIPTFELINSISRFLYSESGIFDFKFSCIYLFKLAQHPLARKENSIKQATSIFVNYLLSSDEFKSKWASLISTPFEDFVIGINSNIKGQPTSSFTIGLQMLAEFVSDIEPSLPDPPEKREPSSDLNLNLKLIENYHKAEKIRLIGPMVNEECAVITRSRLMRCMESSVTSFWQACSICSKQIVDRFNPQAYTLNPNTWPIDTPHVNSPLQYQLPNVKNELPKNAFDVPSDDKGLDFQFKEPFDLSDSNMVPYFHSFPFSNTPHSFRFTGSTKPQVLRLMFNTITEKFGEMKFAFQASFRRLGEPIPAPVFVFREKFLILINAELDEKGDLLLKKTDTPATYRNIAQEITENFFGKYSLFCGHFILHVNLEEITFWRYHLYCHEQFAIEMNTLRAGTFIIVTQNGLPQSFIKELPPILNISYGENMLFQIQLNQATHMWLTNAISSYDYLLILNSFGGRSFADLSQYPVFPWIISDYESSEITGYRNLSLPMGQQSEERAKQFEQVYNGTYMYGAHYSMAASVHFYLLRSPPYTFYDWDLHNGWDNPARIFFDVGYSWKSSSELNTNDVKELIPELFSVPECLMNVCELRLESVKLPAWCKNAINFILIHKEELDKAQIGSWIDLIFGYSQTGAAANAVKNVFLPESYHTSKPSEDDAETFALRLEHWGQCPIQIFRKQHPERTIPKTEKNVSIEILLQQQQQQAPQNMVQVKIEKTKLMFINSAGKVDLSIHDQLFLEAKYAQFSANGTLLVVDFKFGKCVVYAVRYTKGKVGVKDIVPLSSFYYKQENLMNKFTEKAKTVPSGRDLLCATYCGKELILWDACRGTIHRHFVLNEDILSVSFDEDNGLIWISTVVNVFVKTVNGIDVCKHHFEKQEGKIIASCGTHGRTFLFLVSFDSQKVSLLSLDKKNMEIVIKATTRVDSSLVNMRELACDCIEATDQKGANFILKLKLQ